MPTPGSLFIGRQKNNKIAGGTQGGTGGTQGGTHSVAENTGTAPKICWFVPPVPPVPPVFDLYIKLRGPLPPDFF